MNPVSETFGEKKFAYNEFRLGILTFNPAHVVASYFRFMNVGHRAKIGKKVTRNW
jgi:hypothetical protein